MSLRKEVPFSYGKEPNFISKEVVFWARRFGGIVASAYKRKHKKRMRRLNKKIVRESL